MPTFIALLRAVNVGGTGKLPMTDLTRLCSKAGFTDVQTYIASGNVVFNGDKSAPEVKAALEVSLKRYAGKPVGVVVRTGPEMAAVLEANPLIQTGPGSVTSWYDGSGSDSNSKPYCAGFRAMTTAARIMSGRLGLVRICVTPHCRASRRAARS